MKKKQLELKIEDFMDCENIDLNAGRSFDPSQISMISVRAQADAPVRINGITYPNIDYDSIATYPLDYLMDALKLFRAAGATHIVIAMSTDKPIQIASKVSADVGDDVQDFFMNYWCAPRSVPPEKGVVLQRYKK